MAEPVRDTIKRSMRQVRGEPEPGDVIVIGLVENPEGVAFQCPTCNYFEEGICQKDIPGLKGTEVNGRQCCNWYEHPKMRTIIQDSDDEGSEESESKEEAEAEGEVEPGDDE